MDEIKLSKPIKVPFFLKEDRFNLNSEDDALVRICEIARALDRLSNHCTVDKYVSMVLKEASDDLTNIESFLKK